MNSNATEKVVIDGTKVPKLGFGTYTLTGKTCREGVEDALAIGYRHIDTAQMYNNEQEVGDGIQKSNVPRSDIFLTTKVWYTDLQPEQIKKQLEASLKKLQTDYVDLYLTHWPAPDMDPGATMKALLALQAEGKCRHFGVSNFTTRLVDEAQKSCKIFCNQVEYHPLLSQEKLVAQARRENFLLTAYCPLAKGKIFDKSLLNNLAEKYGKKPAQVVLRWFMQQENVAAIPRASSHEHRKDNFDVFDFHLEDKDMDKIFNLNEGNRLINPSWAPDWD